jgi:hypothetical protein
MALRQQTPRAPQTGVCLSLVSGVVVVLYSDGLQTRWRLEAYPGLVRRHPSLIAGVLSRDFARGRDDVTVLVVAATPPSGPEALPGQE